MLAKVRKVTVRMQIGSKIKPRSSIKMRKLKLI